MNFKNLAMWGIIVFLTIGLYNMFKSPQSNIRGGNQIIFSDFLTSVDNGEILKVDDVMSFLNPTKIGARIDKLGGDPGGYDHNYCLNKIEFG